MSDRSARTGIPSARPLCRVPPAAQRRGAGGSWLQPPQILIGRCAATRAVELDQHPVEPPDGRGQTTAGTGLPGDSFARHISPRPAGNTGVAVTPTLGSSQAAPLNGTSLP